MIDMKKRRDDSIGYYDPYRVEMGSWNHLSTENVLCPTLLYLAEILILISLEIGFGVDPNISRAIPNIPYQRQYQFWEG